MPKKIGPTVHPTTQTNLSSAPVPPFSPVCAPGSRKAIRKQQKKGTAKNEE
jgi:hypothetical protein